jgi:hypothetical protein
MGSILEEVVGMIREYSDDQEAIHLNEITARVPADQAGLVWQVTRCYLEMALSGFLAHRVIANSHTGPFLGLNPGNAGHAQVSDDGVDPRVLGNDQGSYHYPEAFSLDLQYFNFDNLQ